MCQNCALDHTDLAEDSQPSIQRLGHRGSHIVHRAFCDIATDPSSDLPMFRIEDVFLNRKSVLIVCGLPNVYTAIYRADDDPKGPGWDKFAAFMMWRDKAFVANTKGRAQAGIVLEVRNLPDEALDAIRREMKNLTGQRGASCARLNAKMLHQAGFTFGNGRSLRRFIRPTQFVSLLWQHGLKYQGQDLDLRAVTTDGRGIGDHIEGLREDSVWGREVRSVSRMIQKQYAKAQQHVPAPVFPEREVVPIDPARWAGRSTTVGINRPRWLGVKLAFLFGQQPVYTVNLDHIDKVEELQQSLEAYPGKLNTVTKLKRYVLFSRPVIAMIRHFRAKSLDYYDDVPARAALEMLNPSINADYDTAILYNCVITLNDDDSAEARITALKNQDPRSQNDRMVKRINWILAKHVLISGYHPKTIYACELWCYRNVNRQLVLCYNTNSGTYKPDIGRGQALESYLEDLFGIPVEFSPFVVE